MEQEQEKTCEDVDASPAPAETLQTETCAPNNERTKTTRHPRWSRQETIILIGAKKVVENGGTTVCRLTQSEPKWDMVSSFCQKHGVNRGPVQCRKRWSNLLSDFKKIKKWEANIKKGSESFWMMRNDERREKKLPGFFDGEVYNVLDGEACTALAFPLKLIKVSKAENGDGVAAMTSEQCEENEEEEEAEAIVDSEKTVWSTEDEAFEIITSGKKVTGPLNASGVEDTITIGNPQNTPSHPRLSSVHREPKHPLLWKSEANYTGPGERIETMPQEESKRRRVSPDSHEDTTACRNPLMKILRRNGNILKAHLSDQNMSYQLARDQQKEQTSNIVAALGKLTDALTKIAEKL
ncbi:trihelix transcription factor ASR3-like [Prosopis cineraria]|uniref:trihelix transcription factor ASR3-like n=1 Tax=Prosopis cineraria TaxID=364024 RepID=UPI002410AD28|nr:trihelix transcription factor ASR3-like [Prosopis cineraria]